MSLSYGRDGFVTYRPASDRCRSAGRAVYLRVCVFAFAIGLAATPPH